MPTASIPVLHWNQFKTRGETVAHVVCHRLAPGFVQAMHRHDFAEVFWGARGQCLHIVNGCELPFGENDLVMIRPDDCHELRDSDGRGCEYYLVSFPGETFRRLVESYRDCVPDFWGGDHPQPRILSLTPLQRDWFENAFMELLRLGQDRLALDRFLLNLAHELRVSQEDPYAHCPPWLRAALRVMDTADWFERGCPQLHTLAGRSREHVARVLKSTCGLTPSTASNRARVRYAAAQLVLTDLPILRIALDAGYAGTGHFYAQFRAFMGIPPHEYRRHHRTVEKAE